MTQVYLVEDCENSPGKIYGVFADIDGANDYADQITQLAVPETSAIVVPFDLWYGQMRYTGKQRQLEG